MSEFMGNAETLALKESYLAALDMKVNPKMDIRIACRIAGLSHRRLGAFRETDTSFRRAERDCLSSGAQEDEALKKLYLYALFMNVGNYSKARIEAGVTKRQVMNWMLDPVFAQNEAGVFESFTDDMNEQIARALTGRKTQVRDFQTLRTFAGKLDSRWKEDPKEITHRHQVQDTRSLDEQITELLTDK